MTQPFPPKPKGMHFLTYMRHAMRAWRAEERADAEVREWVASVRRGYIRDCARTVGSVQDADGFDHELDLEKYGG